MSASVTGCGRQNKGGKGRVTVRSAKLTKKRRESLFKKMSGVLGLLLSTGTDALIDGGGPFCAGKVADDIGDQIDDQ